MWFKRRREQKRQIVHDEIIAQLPEPWREHTQAIIATKVALQVADINRLREIGTDRNEKLRVEIIREDMLTNGIRDPLTIVYDPTGVIMLNGHHRTLIADQEGILWLPVRFEPAKRIRKRVVPWDVFLRLQAEVLFDLLDSC